MKRCSFLLMIFVLLPVWSLGVESRVKIDRVVDGDTVIVQMDGSNERIRVVGIDTPEIVASNRPVECFGQQASDHAKQLLNKGDRVNLIHDNERDKYQRRLGYIELSDGRDFGYIMINQGYAYAYRSFPHDRMRQYVNAERDARLNKQGLWADDACRGAKQSQQVIHQNWKNYFDIFTNWTKLILGIL